MIIATESQFHVYLLCLGACPNSVLNVKALVDASPWLYNFTDKSFAALARTLDTRVTRTLTVTA